MRLTIQHLLSVLLVSATLLSACDQALTDKNEDPFRDTDSDPQTDLTSESPFQIATPTTGDIVAFVQENQVSSVAELLEALPAELTESYTLMAESQSRHDASVDQPRIIMYGTDARFLMGVSSHTDDPLREVIEMVELDSVTGYWRFSQLDFTVTPAFHDTDESVCQGCHGMPLRPIWGQYPDWPGAFGADEDNMTAEQAASAIALKRTQATSDRFKQLLFPTDHSIENNRTLYLPSRSYGYANTAFNFELAASVAEGMFKRVKATPLYDQFSYMLLSSGWCRNSELPPFEDVIKEVGLDGPNDFMLHKFAGESPDSGDRSYDWNQGSTSLADIFQFLILDDLVKTDSALADIVQSIEPKRSNWVHEWWHIRGEERRDYLLNSFDLYDSDLRPQEIIQPIRESLCACINGTAD